MSIFFKKPRDDAKHIEVTISNQTVIRVILLVVATVMALRFLVLVTDTLVLILVAAFLAVALNPAVSWIARRLKSRSRVRATAAAYVTVLVILSTFFSLVIPPLVAQTTSFIREVPANVESFKTQDSALARTVRRYNLDVQLDKFSKEFSTKFRDVKPIFSTAGRIVGTLVSIITVLVLTFMMLVEGPQWLGRLWEIWPDRHSQEVAQRMTQRMYRVVTGYVNGQVVIALIAGGFAAVTIFVASTILNVSVNAVALAGIVVLFGLIPMIGNTIGAILVVLVCLFSSVPLAIVMGVYFLIYQQVENVTIQPYIQAKNNELTPLLVFVAALLGVGFGGIFGAFVAIPLAGCIKIVIEEYLKRKLPTRQSIETEKT